MLSEMLHRPHPLLTERSRARDSLGAGLGGRLPWEVNTLRPRQNGRRFADDIFKGIFLNENIWIPIKISLNFVPKGPINHSLALVQIMACYLFDTSFDTMCRVL